MEQMPNQNRPNVCTCPHHKIVPGGILAIGLAYLLQNFGIFSSMGVDWVIALALIAIGGVKLCENRCKCC